MRVPIVYASVHGSTAEVAHFIADTIAARGVEAIVTTAEQAPPLEGFDALILGSAVHNGLWLPEMEVFVRKSRRILAEKPLYLWLSCMRAIEPGGYAYVTDNYLPNLLSRTLSFRRIGIFAGKVDKATVNPEEIWTLTFRYDGAGEPLRLVGDHRDWASIRAWAERIADDLISGSAPRSHDAA